MTDCGFFLGYVSMGALADWTPTPNLGELTRCPRARNRKKAHLPWYKGQLEVAALGGGYFEWLPTESYKLGR